MNVLVIGDSFGTLYEDHTWLSRLAAHYGWRINNRSIPGSGPLYLIHKFLYLDEIDKVKDYDLVLLLWSEPFRQFAPGDPRHVNHHLGVSDPEVDPNSKKFRAQSALGQDLKTRYWNTRFCNVEHISHCMWFDDYISRQYPTTRFWHFQSFPYYKPGLEHFKYAGDINLQQHYHWFKHGVNITPSLAYFSVNDPQFKNEKSMIKQFAKDDRPGHLGHQAHRRVYEKLGELYEQRHTNGEEFKLIHSANSIELGPYSVPR